MVLVHSPSFVVTAKQDCWKCKASNEIITLAARTISEETGPIDLAEVSEVYLLSYIEDMPAFVFQYMVRLGPRYRKLFSVTADHDYYANVCNCGANFGDWFLFSEPGGAWFPEDSADISLTRVVALPLVDPFLVECNYQARSVAASS
jgi:hypothetical protein